MGSYAHEEDLDEYEDDFIDVGQDGDIRVEKYDDQEIIEEDDEFEEDEVEEEERISEEALEILKYRQKIKEELRSKMRQENGGSLDKSIDRGRKPIMSNFGSFFGPSQPVIADRVAQESKALLETKHLAAKAPKASTSQSNGKNVNAPSISGAKNGVSRQPLASQAKSKVQIIKQTRDYSFLMSDDADVPKPNIDHGQPKNVASKTDSRPSQVPAKSNIQSSQPVKKVVNGFEQRRTPQVYSTRAAPVRKFAPVDKSSVVSSDPRRQLDSRKQAQSQPTRKMGSSTKSGSVRPPMAKSLPTKKPSSSIDKKRLPMEKKAPVANAGNRDRVRPVLKQNVPNGQRQPEEKLRAPGLIRSQERNMSAQHSRDRLLKENVAAYNTQMKPPKQSSLRPNLDRDRARVQKPNGQLSMRSQSGGVKKDTSIKKRKAEEIDDGFDYRAEIRNMFRYDKDKYMRYDDDDDDMCMETSFQTLIEEEKRSAKIAKKEDDEELAKLMEEARRVQLRKKAKMRQR